MSEQITDETLATQDIIQLDKVEKELKLDDLHKELIYRRVVAPDGINAPYFELFYRDKGSEVENQWNTKNGLLSNIFTIVKTGYVIDEIVKNLNSQIGYRKDISYLTFSRIDFVLNGVSAIDDVYNQEDKLDDLMFKLVTNIDPNKINSNTSLSFSVTNAFGGEHTLFLTYGLMTNFKITDINGQVTDSNINNLIILSEYSKKLIHNGKLELQFGDIVDIKNKIQEKVNLYRAIPVTEETIEIFKTKLTKKFFNSFMSIFSTIAEDYHNLFYVSYIFSHILSETKNINIITKISNMLNDIIKKEKELIPEVAETNN